MSVTYGFYNSVGGDRKYSADDFSKLFGSLLKDGIFAEYGNRFEVVKADGLAVYVKSGRAWFNGTWILNDSDYLVEIPNINDNVYYVEHAIVIEIDLVNRTNSIKCISGEPSKTQGPPEPTLANGENGVYHHQLCYIMTYPHSSESKALSIVDRRGLAKYGSQYISSVFVQEGHDIPAIRRNTYRGECLGDKITEAQLAEIRQGKFNNYYIGDYWLADGIKWRIADIDYFMNTGNPGVETVNLHHLVIVPESPYPDLVMDLKNINLQTLANGIGFEQWSDYNIADSYLWTTAFEALFETKAVKNKALLEIHDYEVKSFANPTQASNFKPTVALAMEGKYVSLLNEPMVFGSFIHTPNGNSRFTNCNRQLALFRLCPEFINIGDKYWLRDIESESSLIMVHDSGISYPANVVAANSTAYYRPFFAITLK